MPLNKSMNKTTQETTYQHQQYSLWPPGIPSQQDGCLALMAHFLPVLCNKTHNKGQVKIQSIIRKELNYYDNMSINFIYNYDRDHAASVNFVLNNNSNYIKIKNIPNKMSLKMLINERQKIIEKY